MSRAISTYIVQSGHCGPFKIGRAVDVDRRLRDLRAGSGQRLRLVAVIGGDIERQLHEHFSAHRGSGEWFRAVPSIVDLVNWIYGEEPPFIQVLRQSLDMLPRLPCAGVCP